MNIIVVVAPDAPAKAEPIPTLNNPRSDADVANSQL